MNINSIDSSTNFKAKLVVDKKLANKLPGIEKFRELGAEVFVINDNPDGTNINENCCTKINSHEIFLNRKNLWINS